MGFDSPRALLNADRNLKVLVENDSNESIDH